ncbi:Nonribosomal peptide synthetase [Tolypocladium capitatum]|uniref:Nonribosomal peptide synthetase n=1 Tax=Tolypocladium capitatum TaxID=45235 RepID=A0A2K3QNA0_9HYPO|nr:Nonribosomal peptide synthetase [Tolypocladium capitatum]
MRDLGVNWAFFTPSVAALLSPADVPALRTMVFGGETASPENLRTWAPALHLINSFGPAETSIWSHCVRRRADPQDVGSNIGRGVGCATWITDPADHRRPRPIGAVGEMLVEGPNLAAGYLGEPAKTAAAFVCDPPWMPAARRPTRVYRTGDLARLLPDGSVQFLGRLDHQIKLRGLRIELGEIEHQIRTRLPDDVLVAVDMVGPRPAGSPSVLAAFIAPKEPEPEREQESTAGDGGKDGEKRSDPARHEAPSLLLGGTNGQDRLTGALRGLEAALAAALPAHMVPAAFVPLREMPLTASAKTDRKALKLLASMVSVEELGRLGRVAAGSRQAPASAMERVLARLWSAALARPLDLDVRDGFFRVGGDSLSAMRLVSLARKESVRLSVEQVFKHATLQEMALAASVVAEEEDWGHAHAQRPAAGLLPDAPRFATLGGPEMVASAARAASAQLGVDEAAIEDMYPCSPLQEGLVALSQDARGSYVAQMAYELHAGVDLARFKTAWTSVLEGWPILRTRFFQWHGADGMPRLMQAVMRPAPPRWVQARSLSDHLKLDKRDRVQVGDPMLRLAVFRDQSRGKNHFVMTAHHAIYDGWMLGLLLTSLRRAYLGLPAPTTAPYGAFVAHLAAADHERDRLFWQRYVGSAPRLSWPELPAPDFRPKSTSVRRRTAALPRGGARGGFTSTTLMRAAFAVLLGAYSHAEDVVFASTVYGRAAGGGSAERVAGPTLATVAVRVRVGRELTLREFMAGIQSDAADMLAHEQAGMQSIKRLNPDGLATIDAQSLLVVQVDGDGDGDGLDAANHDDGRGLQLHPVPVSELENGFLSSALVLEATVSADEVRLVATHDDRVLPAVQAERFLRQLCHVVRQLCDAPGRLRLADLDLAPPEDLDEMRRWNPAVPAPARAVVHELVAAQVHQQPEAEALVSHEGSLTYRQLDNASSRLAGHLWTAHGLRPHARVPLVFEKSLWAVVAMLAVLKVGAANVALNPADPADRLRSLVEDVGADLVLCSPMHQSLASGIARRSVCVDPAMFGSGGPDDGADGFHADVVPELLAFLLFTSGSTGRPKAVMIDHAAFCSSMAGHGETLCYRRGSRNLQFTAYTSDVSIGEIFTSLSRGATVCVPSDAERMGDLAGAMERMRVDWAFLTPSVAALLDPARVPTLRTLVFGGETATPTNVRVWAPRLHLINSFGPAETSIWSHAHPAFAVDDDGSDIGWPLGCVTWIADPCDGSRLMPIGAIGELVVEGPNVAAGYYNNPDKTRAAFPGRLPCVPAGGNRIYRTGDLARWMPDGRVQFLGRRDGQVKLHGLKVEMGEVEHALRAGLGDDGREVAVELVQDPGPPEDSRLVAFVSCAPADGPQDRDHPAIVTDEPELRRFAERTAGLRDRLAPRLAAYMIPSFFVPLTSMPLTASAKTNRRLLRALVADGGFARLARFTLASQREIRPPRSPAEKLLHTIWCSVLALPPADFGVEADFFECGGDSIAAMRLASLTLTANARLSVQDVYDNPRLGDLARVLASLHHDVAGAAVTLPAGPANIAPFSLLPPSLHAELDLLVSTAAELCSVEPTQVTDMYPCTPMQRSAVERTVARPGAYWLYNVFEMPEVVDAARLDRAWQLVSATHAVLRTRIFTHDSNMLQAVLGSPTPLRHVDHASADIRQFLAADHPKCGPVYGQPLLRAAVVRASGTGARHLVLALHHAIYDAWSLTRIFAELERTYARLGDGERAEDVDAPKVGFNAFVKAFLDQDRDSAFDFWRGYLLGAETKPFAPPREDGRANCLMRHSISLPAPAAPGPAADVGTRVTHAVTTYAAVALALHRQLQTPDTVLRLVSTGRITPSVPHIEDLIGPTVTAAPLRVSHAAAGTTLREYLAHVNAQVRRLAPFEQTGLDAAVRAQHLDACHGAPQLIVHAFDPYTEQPASGLGLRRKELSALDNDDGVPFTVDVSLESRGRGLGTSLDALHLRLVFDDTIVDEHAARRFVADLDVIARRIASAHGDTPMAALLLEPEEGATDEIQRQITVQRVDEELPN